MKIIECEQGDDVWLKARCGNVTASRIGDMMAKTKSGWGASRANYKSELICERLTGTPTEKFVNDAMRWGKEHEAEAAALYAMLHGVSMEEVGIVKHPTIERALASPDRLVNGDGLLEIKCPQSATHISTLLGASIDKKYNLQMQWQMCVTEREFCVFASFDPRLPAEMQLFTRQVNRDDKLIKELEREVQIFLEEVAETEGKLRALYLTQEAAE